MDQHDSDSHGGGDGDQFLVLDHGVLATVALGRELVLAACRLPQGEKERREEKREREGEGEGEGEQGAQKRRPTGLNRCSAWQAAV